MSLSNSISTESTSSSTTMPTIQLNDQPIDPSNILYNDRQNYQIIFTNDSRFFDTSLHLFKSYRNLGYIQLDNKKSKKGLHPSSSNNTLKPLSNGVNRRWRPNPTGFSSNHDIHGNINETLKPSFIRNHDHSISHRSDPGTSKLVTPKMKRENSPLIVSSQRQSMPANEYPSDNDSSDEPDIIITRL